METLNKRETWLTYLANFSYAVFTIDASLLFITMVQRSKKRPKTQGSGLALRIFIIMLPGGWMTVLVRA